MKPPIEPKKEDCCNSGCNPCIFDVYQKELEIYEKTKDITEHLNEQNSISVLEYTTFIVTGLINLSSTHKIIKFKCINNNQYGVKVRWNPGDHFLLKYTSDAHASCTRAYTPIKLVTQKSENFDFLIIVKKYETGLVSNYVFNLHVGGKTMWRGPYGHYKIEPNKYNRIVMIAQGTGIAPFLSIIDSILNNEDDMTKILLFFCCKNTNEILFRNELYEFNAYWNFSYKTFLSDFVDNSCFKFKYEEPIICKKFDVKELDNLKPCFDSQFLLCGSEPFTKVYDDLLRKGNYTENIIIF